MSTELDLRPKLKEMAVRLRSRLQPFGLDIIVPEPTESSKVQAKIIPNTKSKDDQ